jgi:hypothetical protein
MSENNSVTQSGRDPKTGQFLQGLSGNPAGRSKGSRNKLGEAFLTDLHAEWERSGAEALRRCAAEEPAQFCKIVANLLPKEIDSTLKVDVDLFQNARTFHEAWLIAKQVIGAAIDEDAPMLEAQTDNGG